MARSKALANRLSEVLLDGHWIANTNYKEQIENITWYQATQRIGSLHTIAALTYHVNYYLAGILNVLKGGALEIRDIYSFDMPKIESETDWESLRNEFIVNAEAFVREVAQLSESKLDESFLDESFVDEKYGTYIRNIEGVIEHGYYHLGQISLIKKMISETY